MSLLTVSTCSPLTRLQNVEFLEGYGSFLAETGARAEATTVLQKAAQLDPEDGFEKFM
jgi:kinesin family protein 5